MIENNLQTLPDGRVMNNITNDHNLGPSAKIICDSISNVDGTRLTTMEVTCHRFILAELNTHRAFSRNSASSRAIPYEKIRNRVVKYPAMPVYWGSQVSGMQSGEELNEMYRRLSQKMWLKSMNDAIDSADVLNELGLHKSLVNRLLEPFMWHTAIITATEWVNFFDQRCHVQKDGRPSAQPEMYLLAMAMRTVYDQGRDNANFLDPGEWHLPYVDEFDPEWAALDEAGLTSGDDRLDIFKRVSVARCARVSYLTHDGKRDYNEDVKLHNKLFGATPPHWSPFEHVATPMDYDDTSDLRSGNFTSWHQWRQDLMRGIQR